MIVESASPNFALSAGELVSLREGSCSQVVCNDGVVWLTRDGQLRDVILRAGESFTLPDAAPVLIQALAPSAVRIVPARAPAPRPDGFARLKSALGKALASPGRNIPPDDCAPDVGSLLTSVVAQRRAAWQQLGGARPAC